MNPTRNAHFNWALAIIGSIAAYAYACGNALSAGRVVPSFEKERPIIEQLWKDTPWSKETKECGGSVSAKWHFQASSLPFPEPWPPNKAVSLVYYVRAKELCVWPSLNDNVTGPWARIVHSSDGAAVVERLPVKELKPNTLGHRLTKEQHAILETRQAVMDFVTTLTSLPDEADPRVPLTRRYYCLAIPRGGEFVGQDPTMYHESFIKWLDCPKR